MGSKQARIEVGLGVWLVDEVSTMGNNVDNNCGTSGHVGRLITALNEWGDGGGLVLIDGTTRMRQ